MFEFVLEFGDELRVVPRDGVCFVELGERSNQRFRHEDATVGAKMAAGIG